jgi:antitoxin (DNA-binding transcriptional repressor) of toxin-antitoxin stability system
MATTIDIRELPDRFRELLSEAEAGGEVIVTEEGKPRAMLVALPASGHRVAGLHAGAIQVAPDFDEPLPDEFWVGRVDLQQVELIGRGLVRSSRSDERNIQWIEPSDTA